MLSMDDPRWEKLLGGYRVPYDPRPALTKLESGDNNAKVWEELWNELHHQGDIGDASYAAVPHLVRIYKEHPTADRNVYGIVALIEFARKSNNNPEIPAWLQDSYFRALQELAAVGSQEILSASGPDSVASILSVLALARGARTYAWFLFNYSEDELLAIERTWLGQG